MTECQNARVGTKHRWELNVRPYVTTAICLDCGAEGPRDLAVDPKAGLASNEVRDHFENVLILRWHEGRAEFRVKNGGVSGLWTRWQFHGRPAFCRAGDRWFRAHAPPGARYQNGELMP